MSSALNIQITKREFEETTDSEDENDLVNLLDIQTALDHIVALKSRLLTEKACIESRLNSHIEEALNQVGIASNESESVKALLNAHNDIHSK